MYIFVITHDDKASVISRREYPRDLVDWAKGIDGACWVLIGDNMEVLETSSEITHDELERLWCFVGGMK